MNVVIDTNVVISGLFFGGQPEKVIQAAVNQKMNACATPDIAGEYHRIVREMIQRKQGTYRQDCFCVFLDSLTFVEPISTVRLCRDPADDKFLECAKDAKALYIVSGDKDLLVLGNFEGTEILTVHEFCSRCPELFL